MSIFDKDWDSIKKAWNGIFENFDNILSCIIQIALIIIAAKIIKAIVLNIIKRALEKKAKKNPDTLANKKYDTLSSLLQNICKYAIMFFEVTAILSVLGLGATVTSLLTTAGIGGLAIGLGAQSLINDATNGFFILVDDEFAVGDYVELDQYTGTVESISIRTTRLRLVNNEILTIPNGKITTVINYTRDNYQLFVDMSVSSEEDTAHVGQIMLKTAKQYAEGKEFITGEPSFLGAVDMNSAAQKLRISIMLKPLDQWRAERELRAAFLKSFKENGIKLPPSKESILVKE